ncbi:MFS transporter [Candidatus Bathyarchaeota archaeon]|nr:MFS transporter [Candidatus Bathyarchaeota archaeon]
MLCTAITTADQWLWSFIISRTTPYMITSLGYGTYMFFGALMIIMGFWAIFFIPETKGKSGIVAKRRNALLTLCRSRARGHGQSFRDKHVKDRLADLD